MRSASKVEMSHGRRPQASFQVQTLAQWSVWSVISILRPKMVSKVEHRWSLSAWDRASVFTWRTKPSGQPSWSYHSALYMTNSSRHARNAKVIMINPVSWKTDTHTSTFLHYPHKTKRQMCKTALPWASLTSHRKGLCLASWCWAHTSSSSSPSADTLLWFSQSPIVREKEWMN